MCRPGNKYSKELPPVTGIRPHFVSVLRWVFDPAQTPKLRAVICLGRIAGDFVDRALYQAQAPASPIRVFHTPHPAARKGIGKYEAVLPTWRKMADQLGFKYIAKP